MKLHRNNVLLISCWLAAFACLFTRQKGWSCCPCLSTGGIGANAWMLPCTLQEVFLNLNVSWNFVRRNKEWSELEKNWRTGVCLTFSQLLWRPCWRQLLAILFRNILRSNASIYCVIHSKHLFLLISKDVDLEDPVDSLIFAKNQACVWNSVYCFKIYQLL